ncbi:MAG: aminodeoxychorismate lyase [Pseudomonadota bacterium]|nr:aminodeoxychorismate lyase [Pseudomonadota bacterium]
MSDHVAASVPTWINGQPANEVPVSDRGLAYGDGLFETLRVTQSGPALFDFHLERLQQGLQRLAISHDWQCLLNEVQSYPGLQCPGVVKWTVTRGQGGRGYSATQVQGPTRILSWHPLPLYPPEYAAAGVSVFSCQQALAEQLALAGLKHLNRLEQVLARQEWVDTHQEGLMRDYQGNVIEGVFSNLFLVRQGQLFTPDLARCGVAGTMRRWLLEQFDRNGYRVDVGNVTFRDIQLADEWFFCNSVYGIWPVRQWEQRTWEVGEITRQAQQWVKDRWQF